MYTREFGLLFAFLVAMNAVVAQTPPECEALCDPEIIDRCQGDENTTLQEYLECGCNDTFILEIAQCLVCDSNYSGPLTAGVSLEDQQQLFTDLDQLCYNGGYTGLTQIDLDAMGYTEGFGPLGIINWSPWKPFP